MREKLLLAITITLSLNLCCQVHIANQSSIDSRYQQNMEKSATILVAKPPY